MGPGSFKSKEVSNEFDKRLESICIEITESINRTTETNYIYENMKAAGFEIIKKSPIGNKNSKSFNVIFKRE